MSDQSNTLAAAEIEIEPAQSDRVAVPLHEPAVSTSLCLAFPEVLAIVRSDEA